MENGEDLTWRKVSSTKMTKDNPNSRNTVHLRSRSVHPVRCACIGKEILGIISHLQGRLFLVQQCHQGQPSDDLRPHQLEPSHRAPPRRFQCLPDKLSKEGSCSVGGPGRRFIVVPFPWAKLTKCQSAV
ncbi:uncharacterized protein LOC144054832 [Vanacampus margaritifer]